VKASCRTPYTCQDLHRATRVAQLFHEFAMRQTNIIPYYTSFSNTLPKGVPQR
jgi:hypothetical protein